MGSFRFRKGIKLGPGVRMNVSKSGLGLGAGMREVQVVVQVVKA